MNVTSQRPGVYSSYEASSIISSLGSGQVVGLVALCDCDQANLCHTINSYADGVALFGSDAAITELIRLIFLNGGSQIYAVAVTDEDEYEDAFALLALEEDISIITCDATDLTIQQALRDSVVASSAARNERIAVVCGGEDEDVDDLIDRAEGLNSPRVILVAPTLDDGDGAPLAAAMAGAIAGETDPAIPMGYATLSGVSGLSVRYEDSEVDLLINGGVVPLETVSGTISVIRGVTTCTTVNGASDSTWKELTTIRIIDNVIPAIRNDLRAKFSRSKNTEQSRSAISSQVILNLENKLSSEIITSYGDVSVSQSTDDPTVCLVEFSFAVAHGINQIWLSAQITI